VKDPTKATGFSSNINQRFSSSQWFALSPRVGIKQFVREKVSFSAAISSGFMPAKLDDLCSSRKITKGFKVANPNLKPETLISSEFGVSYNPNKALTINITGYYSYGINFQYFVATGDTIDTGGSELKPVLMRDNVGEVVVNGAELAIRWKPFSKWLVRASGSMSTSEIVKFKSPIAATNIKGMEITEVPDYLASVGVIYLGDNRSVGLTFSHVGRQWIDDVNTQRLSDYQTLDLHLEQTLFGGLRAWLDVQNLFNQIYVDKKGMNCPGRFVMAGLRFEF
jgi:iron complex outermembrane receptor protein